MQKWTEEEREVLAEFVRTQHKGRMDWSRCACIMGTKSARQCYDQYALQKSKVTKQETEERHFWTEEQNGLLASMKDYQCTWQDFQQRFFPNLTLS